LNFASQAHTVKLLGAALLLAVVSPDLGASLPPAQALKLKPIDTATATAAIFIDFFIVSFRVRPDRLGATLERAITYDCLV
jgi:hypothetical protein